MPVAAICDSARRRWPDWCPPGCDKRGGGWCGPSLAGAQPHHVEQVVRGPEATGLSGADPAHGHSCPTPHLTGATTQDLASPPCRSCRGDDRGARDPPNLGGVTRGPPVSVPARLGTRCETGLSVSSWHARWNSLMLAVAEARYEWGTRCTRNWGSSSRGFAFLGDRDASCKPLRCNGCTPLR
jgi:hypothetical protein